MKSVPQRFSGQQQNYEGPLRVVPVEGRRGLRQFIRLPWSIYLDDPAWVPPLLIERRQHLSSRNPFFEHAKCKFWLAYRGATPVGRISAQVDQLHLERYEDSTGFFGLLEAEDEAETFRVLMNTVETWLSAQGMRRVLGPFNLSINQECGLLVEGFDTPPAVMMGHARPYYSARVEENGYRKEKDLLAYRIDADFELTRAMRAVIARAGRHVHVRRLRKTRFGEELQILQDIFEDAWSQNWGFVPFTKAEFEHLGQNLKHIVYDDYVRIAEVDGSPDAMIIGIPNVNEVIRDLNGRLLPFGWLKLLWRLKVTRPKTARVPLMGVRRRYHNSLLGAALALMVIDRSRRPGVDYGVKEVELSWILDDNKGMRNILESLGGVVYKRYRIYGKELC
ncbi:MAG: N-acetyltransferase [Deltaproteobacteria bacterium]|nr:MAG: N-acetyltransferase [Deltaproteobacteria bacterium]